MRDEYCKVCKDYHPHIFVSLHEYCDKEIKWNWRMIRKEWNNTGRRLESWQLSYLNMVHGRIKVYKDILEEFAY